MHSYLTDTYICIRPGRKKIKVSFITRYICLFELRNGEKKVRRHPKAFRRRGDVVA